ncbi:hypothetical protein D9Q98_005258 [Chlorella vulgaris]|uniref:Endoglucanase n=1 Tax=Chlorella vulgaris TaxID=3077 RepID=A0A9D4TNV8_CHLVU|nr:hypothetical protein D9Q98_005258 [Chlorella vulgaris]
MRPARLAAIAIALALGLATLTDAAPACRDVPAPGAFTCKQQQSWGKCKETWMIQGGWCAATCGRCGGAIAPPSSPSPYPTPTPVPPQLTGNVREYGKVLGLSYLFYYAQRSGKLSSAPYNPISWRKDSHLIDRVPGGFYDAGDHLKLNFPLGTSLSFLAWGALEFGAAHASLGQTAANLATVRWGADYLMACHISDNQYIAQIGDPGPDHSYWGRPEEQTGPRPAYVWDATKPASDAAGSAASALASASLLLRASDPEYAAACLDHARRLFKFASKYEGKYSASLPGPTYVYPSYNFEDDLAYAAAWLYRATGEAAYLTAARGYLKRWQPNPYVSWDSVGMPAHLLLLSMGAPPADGINHQQQFDTFLAAWQKGGSGIRFSPRGLAVPPLGNWGNNRHSANAAFLMTVHAKYTKDAATRATCLAWADKQLAYMLGLKGSDRSYVVGYGKNPPVQCHHRGASCPNRPAPCNYNDAFAVPTPNPQVLYGALVGGPGPDDKYVDKRSDYQANEVATDYNAGFTGALAGLVQLLPAAATSG